MRRIPLQPNPRQNFSDAARADHWVDLTSCQQLELACCHYPQSLLNIPVSALNERAGTECIKLKLEDRYDVGVYLIIDHPITLFKLYF